MKNKKTSRKADYSKMKRKLYLYILVAMIIAIALVVFLRRFIQQQGILGNWIVSLLEKTLYFDRQDAMRVYQYMIRNNMEILLYIAIVDGLQ